MISKSLRNISCTNPSGVYAGKMWKSNLNWMVNNHPKWFLKWYTDSKKEGFCDVNMVELLIE